MNGLTTSPLSPPGARRTHITWTNSPGSPSGARSPRGVLLQSAAGMWLWVQSVGGSRRSQLLRELVEAPMEHHLPMAASLTKRKLGTTADGQFGWGGTPLKRYQGGPKLGSSGTETRSRGQGQKPG